MFSKHSCSSKFGISECDFSDPKLRKDISGLHFSWTWISGTIFLPLKRIIIHAEACNVKDESFVRDIFVQ